MSTDKKERHLCECKLCGWKWFALTVTPAICPQCKSKFWAIGRQRKARKKTP